MTNRPHAAVFLARAWWEDGQFRARIIYHVDIEANPSNEIQIVTADPAVVGQQLARWLADSGDAALH